MELLSSPDFWISLLTLATLEIVLGVDNLVFISIAVSELPPERRPAARKFGLALACVTRIGLLLTLSYLAGMRTEVLHLFGYGFSIRDLILIGGGLFLLVKGTMEIHESMEDDGDNNAATNSKVATAFGWVIVQIAIIDIVFSLDSVITAVGLVDNQVIMVLAILTAVAVMVLAADPVGEFIERHPTVKMLALAFLLLVGMALIADGFHFEIPKQYLYFAMAFSGGVEALNIYAHKKRRRKALLREQRQSGHEI